MTMHDFEDDPMGPFGMGPAIEDPIYEAFGDYDLFGPFAWRDIDYLTEEDDEPCPEKG